MLRDLFDTPIIITIGDILVYGSSVPAGLENCLRDEFKIYLSLTKNIVYFAIQITLPLRFL